MSAIGSGAKGLLAQAQRAAQRRAQRTSTGHLLLLMLQGDHPAGHVLANRGVRESDLLSALKVVDDEPASAVEVALERAHKLARLLHEPDADPMHVLLAVSRDPRTVAHRCLERIGSGAESVRDEVTALLGAGHAEHQDGAASSPPASAPRARSVRAGASAGPGSRSRKRRPRDTARRKQAERKAPSASSGPAGTADGAEASEPCAERDKETAVRDETPTPPPVAPDAGVSAAEARTHGRAPRNARVGTGRATPPPDGEATVSPEGTAHGLDREHYPLLSALGRNLTEAAAGGRIDPVIGRDSEIEQLLDVLGRRRANNALLVGPPGVGKTAIVEGLARRLVDGEGGVQALRDRIVVEISPGALVSGTGVRGAVAERVHKLRREVARAQGRVILFIDEIHALVGGSSDGPDDLANELKDALARGELPCIGATTVDEHRKHFERDAALARRFSTIQVDEPAVEDAVRILGGIVPRYETHHAVSYEPEALDKAVHLSVRYLPERHLPDKAVAVLDQAAARVRRHGGETVGTSAVASVVAEHAKVPVDRLLMRDAERLLDLESVLVERVIGQREPVSRIADVLRKGAAGFRGNRPLGTFLLLGPTGVGKTETAKAVSELVFPGGGMTRFDMSELGEAHGVARLLGAPPGYVGHEDGGQLTESVRRRPYQLLLLDEIEKAHPDVLRALLPLLDEGRLTDGRGRTVDFNNTIVFMTSNLGADPPAGDNPIGFGARRREDAPSRGTLAERALAAARGALPPELWNRIDEPLYFAPLGRDDVGRIARRMLHQMAEALQSEHRVALEIEDSAIEALIDAGGYDANLGARPMRRVIGRTVEAPLAETVLRRGVSAGDVIRLEGADGDVRIVRRGGAEAAE